MTDDRITVRVTAGAAMDRVTRGENGHYRVYVTVPPENGKANAQVLRLLARELGVAKSQLEILRGATGRDKIIRVLRG